MPMLTCPSCKESGRVPDKFVGVRIKCKRCNSSLLVTPHGAELITPGGPSHARTPPPAPPSGIQVDGLDPAAWSTMGDTPALGPGDSALASTDEMPSSDETAVPKAGLVAHPPGTKEYKLLTQKDKWFEGKFDLARLEEAINAYARQGWVVKSMATPQVAGFTGGMREEIVVLLER